MKRQEIIFQENMDKLNQMIENYKEEEAVTYLIKTGLFSNEDDLFDYLNQFPTTALALKGLNKKEALLYGFDKEYIDLYRDGILEVMIDKAISSNRIKYLYLDTVSIKYNIFSHNYSYIESNWYLAKIYIEMILDEIEDTIRHFNICNIEDIGNLYVKDAIKYYLEYIENYATENEIDKRILRRISELFHIENMPSFSNKEKTKINFFELNLYMNEVNPMNPIAYNATKNIFVMENDFGILDEEDILIDLDFEVNDVLKRFIDKIPIRMIEKENLYELFYGRKTFKRCKEAFDRLKILNLFYQYEETEAKLNCFGWCIHHDFVYEEHSNDWLKELKLFRS